jgi:spore coat protein A
MTGSTFPAGKFMGGYGPPLPYDASFALSAGKLGGNPDVYAKDNRGRWSFMKGNPTGPRSWELGWKDTVVMYPGQVTRILVRWAPTDLPLTTSAPWFPFDPNGGHGYVWHCHIVDHEDNDMMRPTAVVPDPLASMARSFLKGTDY